MQISPLHRQSRKLTPSNPRATFVSLFDRFLLLLLSFFSHASGSFLAAFLFRLETSRVSLPTRISSITFIILLLLLSSPFFRVLS